MEAVGVWVGGVVVVVVMGVLSGCLFFQSSAQTGILPVMFVIEQSN